MKCPIFRSPCARRDFSFPTFGYHSRKKWKKSTAKPFDHLMDGWNPVIETLKLLLYAWSCVPFCTPRITFFRVQTLGMLGGMMPSQTYNSGSEGKEVKRVAGAAGSGEGWFSQLLSAVRWLFTAEWWSRVGSSRVDGALLRWHSMTGFTRFRPNLTCNQDWEQVLPGGFSTGDGDGEACD